VYKGWHSCFVHPRYRVRIWGRIPDNLTKASQFSSVPPGKVCTVRILPITTNIIILPSDGTQP